MRFPICAMWSTQRFLDCRIPTLNILHHVTLNAKQWKVNNRFHHFLSHLMDCTWRSEPLEVSPSAQLYPSEIAPYPGRSQSIGRPTPVATYIAELYKSCNWRNRERYRRKHKAVAMVAQWCTPNLTVPSHWSVCGMISQDCSSWDKCSPSHLDSETSKKVVSRESRPRYMSVSSLAGSTKPYTLEPRTYAVSYPARQILETYHSSRVSLVSAVKTDGLEQIHRPKTITAISKLNLG